MENRTPEDIRQLFHDHPKLRARDLADKFGLREGQLLAAFQGHGTTRIDAHPDTIMGLAKDLGEVMALTRNVSCVHEKTGTYEEYHTGQHACMVLGEAIDLRMFPSHWQSGFLHEKEVEGALQRSIQVFDAAGDAVHKIYLRDNSDLAVWEKAKTELALEDAPATLSISDRVPPEAAKSLPDKVDVLRKEWARLTDTHQFLRLCSKLKMNRLGAYRIAGAPFVRPLATTAVDDMLQKLAGDGTEVMMFVGNRGCIQIHSGPIKTILPMGPWQNVLDPGFNLHLRLDHIAEVWAVDKPTQRGKAVSVEAFDKDGALILQVFGVPKPERDSRPAWQALVEKLADLEPEQAL